MIKKKKVRTASLSPGRVGYGGTGRHMKFVIFLMLVYYEH